MGIILINTVTTALYATMSRQPSNYEMELICLEAVDSFFLGIYTIEFVLKLSARPRGFFHNGFNCFDVIVLIMSYAQLILVKAGVDNLGVFKVLRSIRALRPLRSVSFIGGLQVIVSALLTTLRTSFFHIIMLLFLLMFVCGIMGYYLFGSSDDANLAAEDWDSLTQCLLSLFVLVTAEGWPDIDTKLNSLQPWSKVYIIGFLFIGHFIFSNLFVAVIIGQIDRATSEYALKLETKQETDLNKKKARAHVQQASEIKKIIDGQKHTQDPEQFKSRVLATYGAMRNDEFIMKRSTISWPLWVRVFSQIIDKKLQAHERVVKCFRESAANMVDIFVEMDAQVDEVKVMKANSEYIASGDGEPASTAHMRRRAVQHENSKPSWFKRHCACFSECHCSLVPPVDSEYEDRSVMNNSSELNKNGAMTNTNRNGAGDHRVRSGSVFYQK